MKILVLLFCFGLPIWSLNAMESRLSGSEDDVSSASRPESLSDHERSLIAAPQNELQKEITSIVNLWVTERAESYLKGVKRDDYTAGKDLLILDEIANPENKKVLAEAVVRVLGCSLAQLKDEIVKAGVISELELRLSLKSAPVVDLVNRIELVLLSYFELLVKNYRSENRAVIVRIFCELSGGDMKIKAHACVNCYWETEIEEFIEESWKEPKIRLKPLVAGEGTYYKPE